MKAAQINDYGGAEALKTVTDADKPSPKEGQVLVEVYAAGANPFDWKVRDGTYKEHIKLTLPAILGGDLSGVVSELGPGVDSFEVGEAVYGQAGAASGQGSFAEFAPVKADQLAPKPASLDFEQAASLPLASVSAYQALVEHIDLQPAQKILIHGGAGGIGSLAIQIAKNIGASVATTVSSGDIAFVKGLGADTVIDYQTQDFGELLSDYDAVFDTVGGDTNLRSYGVLKPGGIMVSMVAEPNKELAEQHKVTAIHQGTKVTTTKLSAIGRLVDAGKLKVNIDKVFPLEEAGQALEYLKTGHPKGKVVIAVKSGG